MLLRPDARSACTRSLPADPMPSNTQPGFVARHVVDAVRNGFAEGVRQKVVREHRFGLPGRLATHARRVEIADRFLLLGADRDDRLLR